ncbi:MAG: amino acid adenylation domain protein, partial [Bacteroidetes bacterium]|nr:amino acid adenylation domain protein [Bacteroidota bacterium]
LSPGKLKSWKERYPQTQLINMYGITETTVHVTYKEITEKEITLNISNIGVPIPTLSCYVLDQHQQLLPTGIPGELYVGGDGLARGYLNREDLTAERFINSPFKEGERLYRSGDKVKRLASGELEYLGRIDDQVKIRGYRIELGEIEHALQKYPAVEGSVVIARKNKQSEEELIAYVISKETLSIAELRAHLSNALPAYMVPSYFVQLETMPLTSNGKIDKKALPDPEGSGMNSGSEYVAPRNEVEEKLVTIWSEVLGIEKEKISMKDNFFEIGGHSLKATRLASQVHKEFEVRMELKELFSNTTPEQQAALIGKSKRSAFINILPAAIEESYPLSSSQRRLWILSQFEDGNAAYNMQGVYVFEGEFNKEALDHSFKTLIERHEILRTVFKEDEKGEIRQWIGSAEETLFKITDHDLRNDAEGELKVRSLVLSDSEKTFDLSSGPLLRASLYRVEDQKHVFSYVMHHIISDGWSMEILIREVLQFYNGFIKGEKITLAPLPLHYKDYSAWQQQELSAESLKLHKEYWLKQFEGELPVLNISKKLRPDVYSYNGDALSYTIELHHSKHISAITSRYNGTDFISLLFFVKLLLHKYTNSRKLIVGTSMAGRNHYQLENQIGLYINNLPLITGIHEDHSLEEFYLNVKEMVQGALQHQDYPLEMIMAELNHKRDHSRQGLFNVMVEFHNERSGLLNEPGIRAFRNKTTKSVFDLSFDFFSTAEGIDALITYNTDLFDQGEIELMKERFNQLITTVATDFTGSRKIGEIDYRIGEEKKHAEIKLHELKENF